MSDLFSFDIKFNDIGKLRPAAKKGMKNGLKKGGFDIEARAKSNAQAMGAVDTGNMMGSVYTSASDESSYGGGSGPMNAEIRPSGDLEVIVAVGAPYGAYVDLGTSRMAGRPFFSEAVYSVRPTLTSVIGEIIRKDLEGVGR